MLYCTSWKQWGQIYYFFVCTLFTKLMLATFTHHHKGCGGNGFEKTINHGLSVMEDVFPVDSHVTCWTEKLSSWGNTVEAPDHSINSLALLTTMPVHSLCCQHWIQKLWHCSPEFSFADGLSSAPCRHGGCLLLFCRCRDNDRTQQISECLKMLI